MPVFACRTITREGALTRTEIEAATEALARANLQGKGSAVLEVRELRQAAQTVDPTARRKKKLSPDELAAAIRQLSILVKAGVPLVESLRSLSEQTRSEVLCKSLSDVADDISAGMSLSDAFARRPGVFPSLAVEMAKISEAGGNLDVSMARLADHMESSAEIRRKVKAALAYPAVVCAISVITTVIMMTFIVPRFTQLFSQMGAKIPWTTRALMAISKATVHNWYIILIVVVAAVYMCRQYSRTPHGKRNLDAWALRLPLVGDIVNKVVLSRVVASMSTLLQSGVPMVKTLEISACAANNEIVREALDGAAKCVADGMAISQALRATGVFPPLVLQMAVSGEKTGELPAMLNYICELYNRETDARVRSLTSVIEPVLIVLLGLVVGTIAISVIVPIYSLVGSVK